ncbi:hypothetical protein HanPI659440_Chr01g0011351 [Helianthus annuus]|nr:hypothetical protein HanPI659440_Chr01g0011351 [Helianthus annuus]
MSQVKERTRDEHLILGSGIKFPVSNFFGTHFLAFLVPVYSSRYGSSILLNFTYKYWYRYRTEHFPHRYPYLAIFYTHIIFGDFGVSKDCIVHTWASTPVDIICLC